MPRRLAISALAPIGSLLPPGEAPAYPPLANGPYMVDFYDKGMAYLKRGSA